MLTGDILIGRRFTGDTTEWMMLSGGFANHAAMIVVEPNSEYRYVIDCPSDLGVFTSSTGRVRRTELNDWLAMALEEDYEIAWLPLDQNLRTFGDLNQDHLDKWFELVHGSPYSSIHNLFAAVDTPDQSFPAPLNAESVVVNLRLYE